MKLSSLLNAGAEALRSYANGDDNNASGPRADAPLDSASASESWLAGLFARVQQAQQADRTDDVNNFLIIKGRRPILPDAAANGGNLQAAQDALRLETVEAYDRVYDLQNPANTSADAVAKRAERNRLANEYADAFRRIYDDKLREVRNEVRRDPQMRNLTEAQQQALAVERAVKRWNEQVLYGTNDYGRLNDNRVTPFVQPRGDAQAADLNDIRQRYAANCYLLAGIGAVARQNPQLIQNAIRENRNAQGAVTSYTVTFYERDIGDATKFNPVRITVDNNFPRNDDRRAGLSGDSQDGSQEIWTQILEKAYAQYYGSYDLMYGQNRLDTFITNPAEVMTLLTGRPSRNVRSADYFGVDNQGRPTNDLEQDFRAGRAVVLNTPVEAGLSRQQRDALTRRNLITQHSYVVQDVVTDRQTGRRTVILYNPHGQNHPQAIPYDELQTLFSYVSIQE